MPRVVFAAPVHNQSRHVLEALESLLAQRDADLAVVVVDDASTDATPELVRSLAARDARVTYERNDTRLGLSASWRRGFALARRRHPEAEYFAWASDHDVWDPRWVQTLGSELDEHPEAVLAYPLTQRIGELGEPLRRQPPWRFDTAAITDSRRRFARFCADGRAGDMVYGLFRARALEPWGFPVALMPDRLLMARLALAGEFRQVGEVLWHRRHERPVSAARQRAAFFPGRVPAWSRVPWPLAHAVALARRPGAEGVHAQAIGRTGALRLAGVYLAWAMWREARKRLLRPVAALKLGQRPVIGAVLTAARAAGARLRT